MTLKFNKKNIYHGLKKRFLKLSNNKYFCFYDGFGSQSGKIWDYLPKDDYKNASLFDVENNIEDLQNDMKEHEEALKNLL